MYQKDKCFLCNASFFEKKIRFARVLPERAFDSRGFDVGDVVMFSLTLTATFLTLTTGLFSHWDDCKFAVMTLLQPLQLCSQCQKMVWTDFC